MSSARNSDTGFTLTELIISLSLLSFILVIAFGLFQITSAGTSVSNREAWISREIASPLEFSERVLSQQIRFDYLSSPGLSPWRCAFFTDRRPGEPAQRYVIEVPQSPDDHRLLVTMSVEGASPPAPMAWSTANHNRAAEVDLFTYFDANGNPINDMALVPLQARAVLVTIVTEHEGRQFSDSRMIFFRNR